MCTPHLRNMLNIYRYYIHGPMLSAFVFCRNEPGPSTASDGRISRSLQDRALSQALITEPKLATVWHGSVAKERPGRHLWTFEIACRMPWMEGWCGYKMVIIWKILINWFSKNDPCKLILIKIDPCKKLAPDCFQWPRRSFICFSFTAPCVFSESTRTTTNNKQQTTTNNNNQQPTTNNQQPTTNNQQPQPYMYTQQIDNLQVLRHFQRHLPRHRGKNLKCQLPKAQRLQGIEDLATSGFASEAKATPTGPEAPRRTGGHPI